ncbi:MAG TPA: FmdB family zinc ribbon protein [Terriglobia bacterium]|nr:FmdB family zinc ribbon protein [Terriglobia bacterium]
MPLYEYQCRKCGKRFEKIQKFSDPPLEVHERCGGAVHRLLSSPAIQFKGSGWYVTDYARKPAPAEGASASSSASSKSETKTESSKSTSSKTESGKADKKD